MKKRLFIFYLLITSLLFFARVVVFADRLGGVEHDSGWYLGVARNLAQRGIYASYTNTIIPEEQGDYPSIHGRFSVQDENGYSYFPAGVTVGPGYIIPEAILLKIFGYDFWQFRLWPLISFFCLLILVFYFAYKLGGWISLIILYIWLWLFPQIYLPMAYEAYGEHVALFYLLLSFFLFLRKSKTERSNYFLMFISGVIFSLSVLTKYLMLLAISSFGFIFLCDVFLMFRKKDPRQTRQKIFGWIVWGLGFVLPMAIFEVYRYLSLVSQFGVQGWKAINKDIQIHLAQNGSGLKLLKLDYNFVFKKFLIWEKFGFRYGFLAWTVLAFYTLQILYKKRKGDIQIFSLFIVSSLAGLIWFTFFSPTGWTRHAWMSLVLGLVLIASFLGSLISRIKMKKKFGFTLILGASILLTQRLSMAHPKFSIDESVINKWELQRYEGGLQGLPTNTIASLSDQKELKSFFEKNVKNKDRVYYLGWFLVAEASPIVDKVFYTYDRYEYLQRKNPQNGVSYLILGPYQKGRLSLVGQSYVPKKIDSLCNKVVFNNPSYTLCTLRNDVNYTNRAYE